jgi:alkylresorcinol/alkylpyrone synthase
LAQSLAKAREGAKVFLVVIETCSLSFRADRLQKADIIATALFGDGSAAACLSTDATDGKTRVELDQGYQKMWPDTLSIMGWDVDEAGLAWCLTARSRPLCGTSLQLLREAH